MSEIPPPQTFYVKVSSDPKLIVTGSTARFKEDDHLVFEFLSGDGPKNPEVKSNGINEWQTITPVKIFEGSYNMAISFSGGARGYLYGIFTSVETGLELYVNADPIGVWGSDDEPPVDDEPPPIREGEG